MIAHAHAVAVAIGGGVSQDAQVHCARNGREGARWGR
jgi:hypothetical protein